MIDDFGIMTFHRANQMFQQRNDRPYLSIQNARHHSLKIGEVDDALHGPSGRFGGASHFDEVSFEEVEIGFHPFLERGRGGMALLEELT
mmetsp:Transcript_13695/g.26768  ORF Transcript_13695/g.26768 Transcript_13695/m.26768 type:complete len:89 (+) Transcript_13695:415-681(+)